MRKYDTPFPHATAQAEGWDLFEIDVRGGARMVIQRLDDPPRGSPRFNTDADAIIHCVLAAEGSVFALNRNELHRRALEAHYSGEIITAEPAPERALDEAWVRGVVIEFLDKWIDRRLKEVKIKPDLLGRLHCVVLRLRYWTCQAEYRYNQDILISSKSLLELADETAGILDELKKETTR